MRLSNSKSKVVTLFLGVLVGCALTGAAAATPGGGGHSAGGGGHSGGGSGHVAGGHGAGLRGGPRLHGGGWGAWHHPWPGGHRPGYRVGIFFPFLPWGFETFWWSGVPYYYADNSYYTWDAGAGEYVTVDPPDAPPDHGGVGTYGETGGYGGAGTYAQASPGTADDAANGPLATPDLYVYPKKDQSEAQQSRDREECRAWAQRQSGFDPAEPHSSSDAEAAKRGSYLRAEAACLEARDYSVK